MIPLNRGITFLPLHQIIDFESLCMELNVIRAIMNSCLSSFHTFFHNKQIFILLKTNSGRKVV